MAAVKGARFRFVLYVVLAGVAGWVATRTAPETWDLPWRTWVPVGAAVAAGATGTFVGEVINALRKITETKRAPRDALEASGEPSATDHQSPAALLRPERAVVAFTGRAEELEWLRAWCTDKAACPVSLVTGPGGVGKTRLALWLAKVLRQKKWIVQPVRPGSEVTAVQAAAQAKERVLLIVDYAETRPDLSAMLTEVAAQEAAGSTGGLRVLLLARHVGEWWTALEAASDATRVLRDRSLTRELVPALDAEHDNRRIFLEALPFYAKARGRPVPQAAPPAVSEPLPVLVLHAAALVAVLDDEQGTQAGRAAADLGVLDRLLDHESRLWADTARRLGVSVSPPVLEQVIAVVALLVDPDSSTEAAMHNVLCRVPDLADADAEKVGALVRWLRQLYPTASGTVDVLRPDLLAERHAANQLADRELLRETCFTDLSESQKIQALTVLARACTHHDHAGAVLGEILYRKLPEFANAAIIAAIQTNSLLGDRLAYALHDAPAPDDTLREVQAKIPYPTVALASAELAVTQRIRHALPPDTDPAETAEWASHHATALAQHGHREEALAAISEAVDLYRELARARPDAFRSDLATALNDQSNRLWGLGRWEEGLVAISEAVDIRRELARVRPDAFRSDLATALNNQSSQLWGLGRWEEVLVAISEAVDIRRELAQVRPDAFRPDLASALNNQSSQLWGLGRWEEVLVAISEAVDIRRELAQVRPDAFRPDLASALNNQSSQLWGLGRWEEVLVAISEAVDIRRELAQVRPDAFRPDLASALNNQSNHLSGLGRWEEALVVISEAVDLYRELARVRPDAFRSDLAMSLNNQSSHLWRLGRWEEGLVVISEAVDIRRELARVRPDAFRSDLAMSLNNQSSQLWGLGRWEEALVVISEAVDLYRELARVRPGTFRPDLAGSLNNQSDCLSDLRRWEEALAASGEAVDIYRELARVRPGTFRPDLASALNNQSNHLSGLGRWEEALVVISEAVDIYRELARVRPDAFRPDLARSLNNQSGCLSDLGRRAEALKTIDEAITIWRFLVAQRPVVHQRQLDKALAIRIRSRLSR
ncbi:tetratricopeptide repeat protein [Saccharopolyspora elongata]|uniref:Anaphase-promoting complex subunit 5 domain-containing protein n=1 Tax=Saccharopolyspora elongata TaxID=2530387 RepID=A0A4R4XV90_9PSEU|nr:tetratricopeptide repeat protein [Saccharopolyspora elongata]TDD34909.1 hypothetical protein E1288_43960 [Saccharopolyspora elongata]